MKTTFSSIARHFISLFIIACSFSMGKGAPDSSRTDAQYDESRMVKVETQMTSIDEKIELKYDAMNAKTIWGILSLGIVSLGGLIYILFQILKTKRTIRETIAEKTHDEIQKVMKEEARKTLLDFEGTIVKLVGAHNWENDIKKKAKIQLLHHPQNDTDDTLKLLESFGFDREKIKPALVGKHLPFEHFDLTIIDDHTIKMTSDEVGSLIDLAFKTDYFFILYTSKRIQGKDLNIENTSAANSRFTLYPRMMEMLRFKFLYADYKSKSN